MDLGRNESSRLLRRAVEIAIADGQLPPSARRWGTTVVLEELSTAIGLARNALRNLRYRDEGRLNAILVDYVSGSSAQLLQCLRELPFQQFSPIVWKRSEADLLTSRRILETTLELARAGEAKLRDAPEPPLALRRCVGAAAAEIMACALTFFDGAQRWSLLCEGERIFLSAMAPLAFARDIAESDARLFARFWENRATRCGLEWSNIWDDPVLPPAIDGEVLALALEELEHAASWMRRQEVAAQSDEGERLRQLLADKAKWLAKAGRFTRARRELARLSDFGGPGAEADSLLVATLERIASNDLLAASRSANRLKELLCHSADIDALAPVTSAIMVHHIELLRGRRPALPDSVQHFLASSPVAASELVHLPRYRARLRALGYAGLSTRMRSGDAPATVLVEAEQRI